MSFKQDYRNCVEMGRLVLQSRMPSTSRMGAGLIHDPLPPMSENVFAAIGAAMLASKAGTDAEREERAAEAAERHPERYADGAARRFRELATDSRERELRWSRILLSVRPDEAPRTALESALAHVPRREGERS